MKYKNIPSAIHNFGHSFLSYENYVDSDYVIYKLNKISRKNHDIKIDWKTKEFQPKILLSKRITKSIKFWHDNIKKHFSSQNVEFDCLETFELIWNIGERPKVVAIDNREKMYGKEIINTL
ncbi:hypothetical protein ACFQ1Q_12780 [Winogradskyella litorisediminis]|uniref:Uncharacterized protein n=1 Tax=Winogradskyella litorisediminis TaxID=1156618 RepID=A0ABW3NCM2_9FLAO